MIEKFEVSLRKNLFSLPGGAYRNTALYDLTGRRVDDTNIVVTPPNHVIFKKEYARAPEIVDVPTDFDVVDEEVLYIGVARDHYGHFLLDSMSRMWSALDDDQTCVFLGAGDVKGEYYTSIMSSLDLKILSPTRPTLYRNILVPTPTMTNDQIAMDADVAHLRVTDKLYGTAAGSWNAPVFLSRRGFRSKARLSPTDANDEERLEQILENAGYLIIHPERLKLAEQIAIFNEAPYVVGLLGSAFHTNMFSRKSYAGKIAYLTFRPEHKSGRYGMIDSIKGFSPSYIQCTTMDRERQLLTIDVNSAIRRLIELGFLAPSPTFSSQTNF